MAEPIHSIVANTDGSDGPVAPPSPIVTPEPAPPDTKLIAIAATSGAVATLVLVGAYRFWKSRG